MMQFVPALAKALIVVVASSAFIGHRPTLGQGPDLPLEKLVNEDTAFFVVLSLEPEHTTELSKIIPRRPRRITEGCVKLIESLSDKSPAGKLLIACDIPNGSGIARIACLKGGQLSKANYAQFLNDFASTANLSVAQIDEFGEYWMATLSTDPQASIERVGDQKSVERFAKFAMEDSDAPIRVYASLPDYFRESMLAINPNPPFEISERALLSLLQNVNSLELTADLIAFKIQLTAHCSSDLAASQFAKFVPEIKAGIARSMIPNDGDFDLFKGFVQDYFPANVIEDRVTIAVEEAGRELFEKQIESVKKTVAENQIFDRMRQLVLGIFNFESAYGYLPPGQKAVDADSQQLLSWRVHILPFLGETELYKRFHIDEPWNSAHNMELLTEMPDVFAAVPGDVSQPKAGYTCIVGSGGSKGIFPGNEIMQFVNIADGTSNTVSLVLVNPKHAVPWTAPQDYDFSKDPDRKQIYSKGGKTPVTFMDGSTSSLKTDIADKDWTAFFTRSGGEIVKDSARQ